MKKLAVLILGASLISGCATFRSDPPEVLAGKSLLAMKQTTVSLAQVGNGLCEQRILDAEKCNGLRDAYQKAHVSYIAAADLYETAVKAKDNKSLWDAFGTAQKSLVGNFTDFHRLATEFGLIKEVAQ